MLCHVALRKPYIFEDSVHFYWFLLAKSWNQDSIIRKGINTLGNQTGIVIEGVNDFNGDIETLEINLPNSTKTNDYLILKESMSKQLPNCQWNAFAIKALSVDVGRRNNLKNLTWVLWEDHLKKCPKWIIKG